MPETPRTATVHVLKITTLSQPPKPCEGGYTCPCEHCTSERAEVVARGVRRRPDPLPIKRAA